MAGTRTKTTRGGTRGSRRPAPHRALGVRGFTLVESIVGLVLLSVSVPPMLWALAESRRSAAGPAQSDVAYWLATERMEDIAADRCSPGRGFAYLAAKNYPDEASIPGFPGFARSVTIEACGPDLKSPGSGFVRVRVAVQWTGGRGTPMSVAATTVLAEKLP